MGGVNSVQGSNSNDSITGGSANETFFGGGGSDTIKRRRRQRHRHGQGATTPSTVAPAPIWQSIPPDRGSYAINANTPGAGQTEVIHSGGAGADGTDVLTNVEVLQFTDAVVLLSSGTSELRSTSLR